MHVSYSLYMARKLPLHQDLLTDVWTISTVRRDVERLLEHVVQLQSNVIALAAAYGVKQPELATLANLSRQRIGQIAAEVDVAVLKQSELRDAIHQVDDWPQDVMGALGVLARLQGDDEVASLRDLEHRQTTIVYGQAEADRRRDARDAFLAARSAADAQESARAEVERARRRVFGSD